MGDIQLAGTFLIGGMVLLTIFSMNVEILETSSLNALGQMAQENLGVIVSIIEYDFKKIGNQVPRSQTALVAVTDSTLSFLADIDQDTNIDTISYRVGPASETATTDNPSDRFLYRSVNGVENDVGLGITQWQLSYFDEDMGSTTVLNSIRVIELSFTVETVYGYDQQYGRASWSSQFAPKNMGVL
jgi:hypothetical protein